MEITMRLPPSFAIKMPPGGVLHISAATVAEAFSGAVEQIPGLANIVFDPGGGIRQYINVFVNKRNIKLLSGLETELSDGDEVTVVLPMTGG